MHFQKLLWGALLGVAYSLQETHFDSILHDTSDLDIRVSGSHKAVFSCMILNGIFSKDVVVSPRNEEFRSLNEENWSATTWLPPSCIISPQTAEDVARALKILVATDTEFSVRSGGHSPHPGWASTDGGVLLAMRDLNSVIYDQKTELVKVGGGAEWQEVYTEVFKQSKRAVVGGRITGVGVAGLTLGGGLGYLSSAHGTAADNVIDYEIVLANSSIVHANATNNPDLFWALKGGSNNFGIVTRFTLKTYPVGKDGKVWGGAMIFDNTALQGIIDAVSEYQTLSQKLEDTKSAFLTHIMPANNTNVVTLVYDGAVERPEVFEPFYKLSPMLDTTAVVDWVDLVTVDVPKNGVPRWDFRGTSYLMDAKFYNKVHQLTLQTSEELGRLQGGTAVFIWQPVSSSLVHQTIGNPLNLEAKTQLWLGINAGWQNEADDIFVRSSLKNLTDRIETFAAQYSTGIPYIFMNDAGSDQLVIESYGKENLRRLQTIAKAYDKSGIFHRLQPGGFKLGPPVQGSSSYRDVLSGGSEYLQKLFGVTFW